MTLMFQQVRMQAGDTVLRQSQTYNGIYFLIQGEVKVTINSESHSKQCADVLNTSSAKQNEGETSTHKHLGHSEILRSLSLPHVHVSKQSLYSNEHLR